MRLLGQPPQARVLWMSHCRRQQGRRLRSAKPVVLALKTEVASAVHQRRELALQLRLLACIPSGLILKIAAMMAWMM